MFRPAAARDAVRARRCAGIASTIALVLGAAGSAGAQMLVCSSGSPAPGACIVTANQLVGDTIDLGGRDLVVSPSVVLTTTFAGLTLTAGNVTFETGAQIVASDPSDVGVGGDVDITAANVWLKPDSGIASGGGFLGGDVTIDATGTVKIEGSIDAHGGKEGFAGMVSISSDMGDIVIGTDASIDASAGSAGDGNTIELLATVGNITVGGTITAVAGEDPGSINMTAGGVVGTVPLTGKLDVSATSGGNDGGEITLSGMRGLQLYGQITSRSAGTSADGSGTGGLVDLRSDGDVIINSPIDVTGPAGPGPDGTDDGTGGTVNVVGASVTLVGKVTAPGKGAAGCGGSIMVHGTGTVSIAAFDVSGGSCGGGRVDVSSSGAIVVAGDVGADSAKAGPAGTITMDGRSVEVDGKVHANGLAGSGPGGLVMLHGCVLIVAATGQVTALGAGGRNAFFSAGGMTIDGPLIAGGKTCTAGPDLGKPCLGDSKCTQPPPPAPPLPAGVCAETGVNDLEYASAADPPAISVAPSPPASPVLNTSIDPCLGGPLTTTTTVTSTSTSTSTSRTSTTRTSTSTSTTATSRTTTTSATVSTTVSTTTTTTDTAVTATSTSSSTTTSSSTSSTAETTSSTTTTTSSTDTVPSTSSTSTASTIRSSTTSTTFPPCDAADPHACDDQDLCTLDACTGGLCSHLAVDGVGAVTCRLDTIGVELDAAFRANLGSARALHRLAVRIAAIRTTVGGAGAPGSPRARLRFKRAGRQLQGFIGMVSHGSKDGKISVGLGDKLLTTAGEARTRILPLVKP